MNYFTELLESYSRLKKRSLRLLEQESRDQNAQALADGYIQEASRSSVKIPIREAPGKFIWKNEEGNIITDLLGWDLNLSNQKNYQKFVAYFSEDSKVIGSKLSPEEKKFNLINPNDLSLLPYLQWKGQDIFNKLFPVPNKISKFLQKVFPDVKGAEGWQTKLQQIQRLLNGNKQKGSLAKALFQAVKKIHQEGSGFKEYDISESQETEDLNLKLEVQDRLIEALDIVTKKESITSEECVKLQKSVIPLSRGRIAIRSPQDGGRGLIFNDNSGFLNSVLGEGAKTKGCELKKQSIGNLASDANALRGDFMESLEELVHVVRKCASKMTGDCTSKISKITQQWQNEREKLSAYFSNLEKLNEKSATDEISTTFEVEGERELHDSLKKIFGDTESAKNLIKRITVFALTENKIRNPDYLIRVGKTTGDGKRADTLELYDSKEKAIKALLNQGIPENEIDDIISEVSVEKLCAKLSNESGCPSDTSKPYFSVTVGLKNYLNLSDGIHLGKRSADQISMFIAGEECSARECTPDQIESNKKLRKSMAEVLGESWLNNTKSKNYSEMLKLHEEMEKIDSNISNLGPKFVKRQKGEELSVDTLKEFGETLLNTLKKEKTYNQFINDEMSNLIKEYAEERRSPEEIKAKISEYLKNSKLKQLCDANNRVAKTYLASKIFLAGASSENGLISTRSLENNELFISRQNSLFSVLKDFISGNNVEFNKSNSTLTIQDRTPVEGFKSGRRVSISIDVSETGLVNYKSKTNAPNLHVTNVHKNT